MSMTKEQVLAVLASAAESLRAEIEARRAGELPRRIERDLREVDELDQARAAIASWPEPATWQPIETAPKDGARLLVADPPNTGAYIAHYWDGWWIEGRKRSDLYPSNPAHWMSLPEPPQ